MFLNRQISGNTNSCFIFLIIKINGFLKKYVIIKNVGVGGGVVIGNAGVDGGFI